MTRPPEFRLLPISLLSIHEEIDPRKVDELVQEIERSGIVREPIWVAEDHHVILNGHHRFQALRQIGAVKVPAWVVPYDDPRIQLARWGPGPAVTKAEVIARAKAAKPFPPKTTKHSMPKGLPPHPTALADLLPSERHRRGSAAHHRASSRPATGDPGS